MLMARGANDPTSDISWTEIRECSSPRSTKVSRSGAREGYARRNKLFACVVFIVLRHGPAGVGMRIKSTCLCALRRYRPFAYLS
jgi:hypothetical protein